MGISLPAGRDWLKQSGPRDSLKSAFAACARGTVLAQSEQSSAAAQLSLNTVVDSDGSGESVEGITLATDAAVQAFNREVDAASTELGAGRPLPPISSPSNPMTTGSGG